MSDTSSMIAAHSPEINAIVAASAGTGKTYLLVTRIIRQLLSGAAAERILALTFTRKAAGEMRQRLLERLRHMATISDADLHGTLTGMDIAVDADLLNRARRLYESILLSPRPLRISTFHAFCQQLLQRFPLEADVPPGYELLQAGGIVQTSAWDALFLEATHNPEAPMAQALQTLFVACNGSLDNVRSILMQAFLARRNDWLAYTQNQENRVDYACERLKQFLQLDEGEPLSAFFNGANSERLRTFRDLLLRHATSKNLEHAVSIEAGLNTASTIESRFELIKGAFLTRELEPRQRKSSNVLEKALGAAGVTQFLELHEYLCQQLLIAHQALLRREYWKTGNAWYRAGDTLLHHYQRIKQEQRLLDFDDLEWKTYSLLHHQDHALWVQYKIDQKIDHLLIDEFQDTNPTQWRLLLPLLEEMAGANKSAERRRSVFLVGDGKQSIYGFRRADPQLQEAAGAWLQQHLDAREFPLIKSWRSADAIMQTLNHVFLDTEIGRNLHGFQRHVSHRSELWGQVEILPLVEPPQPAEPAVLSLRDPLTVPRSRSEVDSRYLEGQNIARRIHEIIDGGYCIEKGGGNEGPADYDDIFILFRTRTHIAAYEQALTDAAIPFLSLEKGTLLEQQEVEDIEALLNVLLTPFNNLALAQVLKSPIFGASDEDLLTLSLHTQGDWYGRLKAYAEDSGTTTGRSPALLRAWNMLAAWRKLLPELPLHDLLDRIFHQGELIPRYRSASPPLLADRVVSNLQRLLALALEIDSGRYPSLSNFLLQLKRIRASEDQPDSPPLTAAEHKVRLMTIHAAKGLEAPVVFVADACTGAIRSDSYHALVDWPHTAEKPEHLLLYTTKAQMPSAVEPVLERQRQRQLREQANLLYVALSRAKQMLFISGSGGSAESMDWYRNIALALSPHAALLPDGGYRLTSGMVRRSQQSVPRGNLNRGNPEYEPALFRIAPAETVITPGASAEDQTGFGGTPEQKLLNRQRGAAIHKMLEMLSAPDPAATLELNGFLDYGLNSAQLSAWKTEVLALLAKPELQFLFNPELYDKAYKEVPLAYKTAEGKTVYGIIDRVVIRNNEIWVIDYKTRSAEDAQSLQELLQQYRPQLHYYAEGLKKIWPGKTVRPAVLLTAAQTLHTLD
jgi:ATP-dependent helicase/nuclease subunit A